MLRDWTTFHWKTMISVQHETSTMSLQILSCCEYEQQAAKLGLYLTAAQKGKAMGACRFLQNFTAWFPKTQILPAFCTYHDTITTYYMQSSLLFDSKPPWLWWNSPGYILKVVCMQVQSSTIIFEMHMSFASSRSQLAYHSCRPVQSKPCRKLWSCCKHACSSSKSSSKKSKSNK